MGSPAFYMVLSVPLGGKQQKQKKKLVYECLLIGIRAWRTPIVVRRPFIWSFLYPLGGSSNKQKKKIKFVYEYLLVGILAWRTPIVVRRPFIWSFLYPLERSS